MHTFRVIKYKYIVRLVAKIPSFAFIFATSVAIIPANIRSHQTPFKRGTISPIFRPM